jgi:hypothetical protein
MTPEAALAKQIELYRKMTPEQRRQLEIDRYECACEIAREGIRHENPTATPEEVERLLRERIRLGEQLCRDLGLR